MTTSIFDRWLLGAGGLIALLVVAIVLTFQNNRRLNEETRLVVHTHEVMNTLEEISGSLREAEAVQRTYLYLWLTVSKKRGRSAAIVLVS